MFLLCYFLQLVLLLKFSICTQLCVDNCQVEYDLYGTFTLPSGCSMIQRDYCYVLTIFDYVKQTVKVEFNADFDNENRTTIKIKSIFSLEEPESIEHLLSYTCSTGDHCDIEYIRNLTVQRSAPDACQRLRSQLIDYLDPPPLSTVRDCYIDEQTTSKCQRPCEFIYKSSSEISRSCSGDLELTFEMIIEKSRPTNQSESDDSQRTWSFSCTTSNCNGRQMQDQIDNLIHLNRKPCFFSFDDDQPTTTTVPLKAQSVSFQLVIIFLYLSLIFIL